MTEKEEPLDLSPPSMSTVPSCGGRKSVNWAHPLASLSTGNCPIKRCSSRLGRKTQSIRASFGLEIGKTENNFEKRVADKCSGEVTLDVNAATCSPIAYCKTNKASTEAKSIAQAAGSTEPPLEPKRCLNEGCSSRIHKRPRKVQEQVDGEEDLSDSESSMEAQRKGCIQSQGKGWISVPLNHNLEANKSRNADRVTSEDGRSTSSKVSSETGLARASSLERSAGLGNIRVTCKEKDFEFLNKRSDIGETLDNEYREALSRSKRVVQDLEQLLSKMRENKLHKLQMEKAEGEASAALEQERLRAEITQLSQTNAKILDEKLAIEKDFSGNLQKELDSYRLKVDKDHAEIVATLTMELGKEQEKSRCQICFTSPRDALILPCLHFQYCNECLREHQRRLKECPTCRAKINGVIRCTLLSS